MKSIIKIKVHSRAAKGFLFLLLLFAAFSLSCDLFESDLAVSEADYPSVPDGYRSFDDAISFLRKTQDEHPEIAWLTNSGRSVQNREIPVLIVSKNPKDYGEDKPGVRLTGSIHGNEYISGEILFRFIGYLVSKYDTDPDIRELVDGNFIAVMPILNPDGHESGKRLNANKRDLNRDFVRYDSAGGKAELFSQPESRAVRDFMPNIFDVSLSFHSGAVVVNLPLDFAKSSYALPARADLVMKLGRIYADAGFKNNPELLRISSDGVITGGDWYVIEGSLQDWSYMETGCIDITVEVAQKSPDTEEGIEEVFLYNRDSIIEYIKAAKYVRDEGVVSDFCLTKHTERLQ